MKLPKHGYTIYEFLFGCSCVRVWQPSVTQGLKELLPQNKVKGIAGCVKTVITNIEQVLTQWRLTSIRDFILVIYLLLHHLYPSFCVLVVCRCYRFC